MTTVRTFKQRIHEHCQQLLAGKVAALQEKLDDLSESVANETRSTAGDKYETARAMLHIEQDQLRQQMAELMAQQAVLKAIDPTIAAQRVALGSLVQSHDSCYYLSIALGRIQLDDQTVIALSLQSPLGSKLRGLAQGDELTFNGRKLTIREVL